MPVPSYIQNHIDGSNGVPIKEPQGALPKVEDVVMGEPALEQPTSVLFSEYANVEGIPYSPENALKEGLLMVESIKNSIKILRLGSKLRQEVWQREIKKYESLLFLRTTLNCRQS